LRQDLRHLVVAAFDPLALALDAFRVRRAGDERPNERGGAADDNRSARRRASQLSPARRALGKATSSGGPWSSTWAGGGYRCSRPSVLPFAVVAAHGLASPAP